MRPFLLAALLFSLFSVGSPLEAAGKNRIEAKAKLIHLRGKRYQMRVVSTLPTGGYSKRATNARRFLCADDCQPFILVTAPIQGPAPDDATPQVLTRIRHRKNIRLPRFWKAVVVVRIDGKTVRRFAFQEQRARPK